MGETKTKLAVVSGATGGIGKAIVERLAIDGFQVAMLGRDLSRLQAISDGFSNWSSALHLVPTRGLDDSAIATAIMTIHPEVTALVLAAGSSPVGTLADTTDEMWLDTIDSKLLSAVRIMRTILPLFRQDNKAATVFVDGAFAYEPDPLFVINGAVNCALAGFAKAVSRDPQIRAAGIRVNVVHPGATDTPLWHQTAQDLAFRFGVADASAVTESICEQLQGQRLTAPEEIAEAVAFLLSPAATRITGAALTVDGGGLRALI